MHANAVLIGHFYDSFKRRDSAAMAACYAPDAHFHDPIFDLKGDDVAAMWTMFCERGRDLVLEWRDVQADDASGSSHWEPRYTFSVTGRKVHNVIDSRFTFREGRIATHADTFNLWRWSRMALGPKAIMLGWTPFVKKAIKAEAQRGFEGWKARRRS
ncbi:MAG: nuclear transport factor 2 family protein [Casimicrobiaceae bacterium]